MCSGVLLDSLVDRPVLLHPPTTVERTRTRTVPWRTWRHVTSGPRAPLYPPKNDARLSPIRPDEGCWRLCDVIGSRSRRSRDAMGDNRKCINWRLCDVGRWPFFVAGKVSASSPRKSLPRCRLLYVSVLI